jgi:hypothetical protein
MCLPVMCFCRYRIALVTGNNIPESALAASIHAKDAYFLVE